MCVDFSSDILILTWISGIQFYRDVSLVDWVADKGCTALYSLSAFKRLVEKTHKDLEFFAEATGNYNFDEWMGSMKSKLEPGLSDQMQFQL